MNEQQGTDEEIAKNKKMIGLRQLLHDLRLPNYSKEYHKSEFVTNTLLDQKETSHFRLFLEEPKDQIIQRIIADGTNKWHVSDSVSAPTKNFSYPEKFLYWFCCW